MSKTQAQKDEAKQNAKAALKDKREEHAAAISAPLPADETQPAANDGVASIDGQAAETTLDDAAVAAAPEADAQTAGSDEQKPEHQCSASFSAEVVQRIEAKLEEALTRISALEGIVKDLEDQNAQLIKALGRLSAGTPLGKDPATLHGSIEELGSVG